MVPQLVPIPPDWLELVVGMALSGVSRMEGLDVLSDEHRLGVGISITIRQLLCRFYDYLDYSGRWKVTLNRSEK